MSDKSDLEICVKGVMKLTSAQEVTLKQRFVEELTKARRDWGWQGKNSYGGLLLERWEFSEMWEGRFDFRRKKDALFAQFNTSDNGPQRAIRNFKAKANEKLLNIEPFASLADARRKKVDARYKKVDEYFAAMLGEADGKSVYQEAIVAASIRGEAIVKAGRRSDVVSRRRDVRMVMIGGVVLTDSQGVEVHEGDEWEAPDAANPNLKVLKRDPAVKIEGEPELSTVTKNLPEHEVRTGLELSLVSYLDFFCAPTARDIYSDPIFQMYDLNVADVLTRASMGGGFTDAGKEWIDKLQYGDQTRQSESAQANQGRLEENTAVEGPRYGLMVEGYIREDFDGDGRAEDVQVTYDEHNDQLVSYDYVQEASPTADRPFSNIRLIPVEGRWHGIGHYKLLENQHTFVDRQRNRIDARSSINGNLKLHKPGKIRDLKMGIKLRMNDPRWYTVEDDADLDDVVKVVEIPPLDENIKWMYERDTQLMQLLSGTLSPGEQDFSDSPGADTLGGLEILAKEAEMLNADSLQEIIKGLRKSLGQAAYILLAPGNFDAGKAAEVIGEQDSEQVIAWVSEQDPRTIMNRITLSLTKARTMQQLQANKQAIEILNEWEMLPGMVQKKRLALYIDMLNSLEIQDPEAVLGDPEAKIAMEQAAMMGAAPGGLPPPTIDEQGTIVPNEPSAPSTSPTGPVGATQPGSPGPIPGL
jgi:hypothetical protein